MLTRVIRSLRRRFGITSAVQFNPEAPFGKEVRASKERYLQLFEKARGRNFPAIDSFLAGYAHEVDRAWLDQLALHTQIVVKHSELNYQHGRVLYALLRQLLASRPEVDSFTVLETGTSRGFSIITMARALIDAGRAGKLITLDIIEHNRRHLWNCIDDHEGPKSREELLSPWGKELDLVVFLSGDSRDLLKSLGLLRVHFAFLDGGHTEADVMEEFAYVSSRQLSGDMIVFDDVTPGLFDGIVAAVERIERDGRYKVERLMAEERRSYAVAIRT